ncbi:ABC transporter permease [candidate division KSB1 bacterium]|nr:ABC transporter permease [candidate division KSB1 bacterium]
MFKNYLKITWRNLVRQKANSFINITGLAIGMTCSMLILMWVQHELSYDTFHENANDIYRVVENQYYAGGQIFPVAVTPSPLAPALKTQFPEISKATRFSFNSLTIKKDDKIFTEGVAFADPDILEIFTIPFVKGSPQTALSAPHSIVLTEEAAAKYFGQDEPVGQVLRINHRDDFLVTGVIENIPENSHLKYDLLAPFIYLKELGSSMEYWGTDWCYTYVLLQKNTPYKEVDKKIIDFIKKNHEKSATEIYLQLLTEIHLYSSGKYTADIGGHGDIQYVRIFAAIAFFVLLIACINFMNLATARSERRAKEVGLRKVVGAQRHQLINQFFSEAIILSLLAFLAALVLTETLLPAFNDLSGKTLSLSHLETSLGFGSFAIALLCGIISGSYPAFYLSSFHPIATIKSNRSSQAGGSLFRKILVVFQFALSVIMIIGTLVVSRQMDYIRNKNLGLDKENLGYFWMSGEFRGKSEIAKQELLKNPNITGITRTSQLPTYVASSSSGWKWEGKDPSDEVLMHTLNVDEDYVKTFKMEMAEGRFFSRDFPADSHAVVVNETATEVMGMQAPIGKRLTLGSNEFTIIGVVKDFHFKPIRMKIEPLVMMMAPDGYFAMIMRMRPENFTATIEFIEKTYKQFAADTPFYFNFLDEVYDNLYRAEQRVGKLSGYFSVMAILIASLGLYGLASYMAEQRTKEIGIRKVLGASIPALFFLLSKNFLMLAGIANLIAWPVAYFVMSGWLQNYAYRISLNVAIFVVAAALAMIIVLVTVSYQALKAALANPVEALRYE